MHLSLYKTPKIKKLNFTFFHSRKDYSLLPLHLINGLR